VINVKTAERSKEKPMSTIDSESNIKPAPEVHNPRSGAKLPRRPSHEEFAYGSGGLKDFSNMIEPLKGLGMVPYVGDHDRKDPVLSPMYADMRGFPPTLCMTSTRDHCLSGTVDFHRALLRAGVDARLMVFDALPHAFWYQFDLPESKEALDAQASFLDSHLG
jgi:acetyl esterase/lipase